MSDTAQSTAVPPEIEALIGERQYPVTANFPVERAYGYNTAAATANGNPLYWDDDVAAALTGGPIAPPTTLSLWIRPHYWEPGAEGEQLALQVHFDLKAVFGLPEAVMTDNTLTFYDPVRPGDVISHAQVLKSVSGPKTTKLGAGRFWVIDLEYHNQNRELVGIESYTGFGHQRDAAKPDGGDSGAATPPRPPPAGPQPCCPHRDCFTATWPSGTPCPSWQSRSPPPPWCSGPSPAATGGRCTTTSSSPPSATALPTSFSIPPTRPPGSSATSPTGPAPTPAS